MGWAVANLDLARLGAASNGLRGRLARRLAMTGKAIWSRQTVWRLPSRL